MPPILFYEFLAFYYSELDTLSESDPLIIGNVWVNAPGYAEAHVKVRIITFQIRIEREGCTFYPKPKTTRAGFFGGIAEILESKKAGSERKRLLALSPKIKR